MSDFELLTSSKTSEWYTPVYIIESARKVMGGIYLDPASNPIAQRWIKAGSYYTKEQNGLSLPWYGRVWLNPPFGRVNSRQGVYGAGVWFRRLYKEYTEADVFEALALGRGDSDGFKLLTRICYFVECDRIAFVSADGITKNKPVPGTKIFYLGLNVTEFIQEFRQYGTVLRAV
ncbi:MAG: DNA N-6-adenine-methyltransferase [Brasilonema sp.]